jgi:glutathione synthase/RimK-type ligase-like ATP-grasp enzyme
MLTPLSQSMAKAPLFVRTSAVAPADLEALDGLRYSPMVFQERIEKALELRVAVVGERLFAGAIDASASAHGQVDWRGASAAEVRWQSGAVEPDAAGRLTALTRALGLVYGAVDLIREPSGRLVFLEINPGGEWGMLERDLGLPIADALAEALLETAEIAR